jgi:hypothetical protein
MACVVTGWTILSEKSKLSVNVVMIIGALTFQIGLASRMVSYASIDGSGLAIFEHLAEDVRWEHHPTGNAAQDQDVPYMRPRSGRAAAAGFFQDIEEDFEMNSFNPHSFLEGTAASRQ